jgi:hypothetical protein
MNATKPSDFITKHKEEYKKKQKSTLPDIGSYKPFPVEYDTFGKRLLLLEKKEKNDTKTKIKYWVLLI